MELAILGCGKVAQQRHAPECQSSPAITLAGFYDLDTARARDFSARFGGKAYESLEEIWTDKAVDGVIVCTANTTHRDISLAALAAGKHVLCEKPMAPSVQQAEEMARAAAGSGRLFMVAQDQRFDPVNAKAKQMLEAGIIGKVLRFTAEFSHGGPEGWSVDGKNTMYFKKSDSGYGAVGDLGSHKVDLMRWMLDMDVNSVFAQLATLDKCEAGGTPIALDDNALITVTTNTGAMGVITASWTNYGRCESTSVVFGTEGVLYISDCTGNATIKVEKKNGDKEEHCFGPRLRSNVVDAFVQAVQAGVPSPVSAEEGLQGIRVIEAAVRSHKEGKRVSF